MRVRALVSIFQKYLSEKKEINQGINFLSFLSKYKIMSSKSEARRAIINNGLKINDILIKDEKKIIIISDFKNKIMKISHGKKKALFS